MCRLREGVTFIRVDDELIRDADVLQPAPELVGLGRGTLGVALTNDNAPGQLVVGGTPAGVAVVAERALDNGVRRTVSLNVEAAFHTPLMEDACDGFGRALESVRLERSTAPVVSNDDAEVYADGDGWRWRLVRHLVSPVRWRQSIQTLVGLGVKRFVELGPGTSVAGMARRTVPSALTVTVGVPAQLPALLEVV